MTKTQAYIGDASMDKHGAINIHLRQTADGQPTSAHLHYLPGTKEFEEVLSHIGGIRPGETKLVKPFDEAAADLSYSNSEASRS